MEQGFSFSTIAGSEREASLSMYEVWLGTQKGKIEEGLADPQRLQQCSQDMRGALAGFFQNEYALPQDNIAVFSGRSAPLHRLFLSRLLNKLPRRQIYSSLSLSISMIGRISTSISTEKVQLPTFKIALIHF